jgi:hypothetical protein
MSMTAVQVPVRMGILVRVVGVADSRTVAVGVTPAVIVAETLPR